MSTKVTWHGDKAKKVEHEAAARGLLKAVEHVLAESVKIVPEAPDGRSCISCSVSTTLYISTSSISPR